MDIMNILKLFGGILLLFVIFWIAFNVIAILIMFGIKIYDLNNQFLDWLGEKLFGERR